MTGERGGQRVSPGKAESTRETGRRTDDALHGADEHLLLEGRPCRRSRRSSPGELPVEAEFPVELHFDDGARVELHVDARLPRCEGRAGDGSLFGSKGRELWAERDVRPARVEGKVAKVGQRAARRVRSTREATRIVRAASLMTLRSAC